MLDWLRKEKLGLNKPPKLFSFANEKNPPITSNNSSIFSNN